MVQSLVRKPTHPGEILLTEFMHPNRMTGVELSKRIGVSNSHLSRVIRGYRPVSPALAHKLAKEFYTSINLWLNLQENYDRSVKSGLSKEP